MNRAQLLRERYEQQRRDAEMEAARQAGRAVATAEDMGRPGLLGRVLGGSRRRSKGIARVEGYGT